MSDLLEDKRLVAELRADAVVGHDPGPELPPDGVARQPEHVHLHVGAHVLVRQELARQDLDVEGAGDDAVDGGVGEGVEDAVVAAHEDGLAEEPAPAVVLVDAQVQLHRQVWGGGILVAVQAKV